MLKSLPLLFPATGELEEDSEEVIPLLADRVQNEVTHEQIR